MRLQLQVRSDQDTFGGESWLWERRDFRVLVDIGFASEFRYRAASFSPDVIVLTHDDVDHIGRVGHAAEFINHLPRIPNFGLPSQVLSDDGPRPIEFWLPMDWLHLAHAVLQVLNSDASEATVPKIGEPTARNELEYEYTLRYFESAANRSDGDEHEACPGFRSDGTAAPTDEYEYEYEWGAATPLPSQLGELAEISDEKIKAAVLKVVKDYRDGAPSIAFPADDQAIADRAVASSIRVGSILAALASNRTLVRFFDVDRVKLRGRPLWPDQGIKGTVTIINAVETPQPRFVRFHDPARAVLFISRLTIQNQRALATFLWPTTLPHWSCDHHGGDGVIIWSDTTLDTKALPPTADNVPWRYVGVMSAPHHASADKAHRPLWDHRPLATKVILSNNNTNNAIEWLNLSKVERDCAGCGQRRRSPVGATSLRFESGVALLGHCHCI